MYSHGVTEYREEDLVVVRDKLLKAMDDKQDSLRIYNLGSNYANRIEHYGVKTAYDPEDALIL